MKRLATLTLCALALLAHPALAQQKVRIGYVNGFRIETDSAQARLALAALNKEFEARHSQIDALQKKAAAARQSLEKSGDKLPPAERQSRELDLAKLVQQFERMSVAVAEELELRKNQERARIAEEANIVIRAIAEAGKYDLVLQEAYYSNRAIDITDQVLKEMAKRAAGARR